jgi:hypothetical protein
MAEEPAEQAPQPATIHILGEGGGVFELSLPLHETIADKLAKGHVRRVQPDGSPYVEGDRPDGVPSLLESRPAINAVKAEWVGWAVVQGLSPDEAEALTKTDLIERFGAGQEPAEPAEPVIEPDPPVEPPAE